MIIFKKKTISQSHKWQYKKPRTTDVFTCFAKEHINANCRSSGVLCHDSLK